jgi:hypothetical protein
MRDHLPACGRFRRSLRRAGFDRNPMWRGTDRIQAITRAALLAAFLAGAPAAGAGMGHAVYVAGLRAARAQEAATRPVTAVVLRVTPMVTGWSRSRPAPARYSIRWTSPPGSSQTGEITGVLGDVPGGALTVWVDAQDQLTSPPLSRAQIAGRAAAAAVAATVVDALLLALAGKVVSLALDKRRLASWAADWSAVEPQWTGRK